MIVQLYGPGGQGAQTIEASRVVVLDDNGIPLVFAATYGREGQSVAASLQDPNFEALIATLGLSMPKIRNWIDIDNDE